MACDLVRARYDDRDRLVPDDESDCPLYKRFPVSCDTEFSCCIYFSGTKEIGDMLFARCVKEITVDE